VAVVLAEQVVGRAVPVDRPVVGQPVVGLAAADRPAVALKKTATAGEKT